MKKFFLSALAIASISIGILGCNNGAYDARPDVDNSKNPNPLNPNIALGTMRAKVNGKMTIFSAQAFDSLGLFVIYGGANTQPQQQLLFSFNGNFGVKTYLFNDTTTQVEATYVRIDGTEYAIYESTHQRGHVRVEITENADNKIKGNFDGEIYRVNELGEVDLNSGVWIDEGTFYVEKK